MKKTYFFLLFTLHVSFFTFSLSARTRIKTVEYSFGGRYVQNNVAAGGVFTFPSITVYMPENGKAIRNAYLDFECEAISVDVTYVDIRFDQGASASTTRLLTGQYTEGTAEEERIHAVCDVTGEIANAASQQYTAAVSIGGAASNIHTLKLFVTYEYDDTSPAQVKTVRFPLYSDMPNKIATR